MISIEKYIVTISKESADIIKEDLGSVKNGVTALVDFYKSCDHDNKELIKTASHLIEHRKDTVKLLARAKSINDVIKFINTIQPRVGSSKFERKDVYTLYLKWTYEKNINALGKIDLYEVLRPLKNITEGRTSMFNYFKIHGKLDLF